MKVLHTQFVFDGLFLHWSIFRLIKAQAVLQPLLEPQFISNRLLRLALNIRRCRDSRRTETKESEKNSRKPTCQSKSPREQRRYSNSCNTSIETVPCYRSARRASLIYSKPVSSIKNLSPSQSYRWLTFVLRLHNIIEVSPTAGRLVNNGCSAG